MRVLLAALMLILAGCSYSTHEPGLFRQTETEPTQPTGTAAPTLPQRTDVQPGTTRGLPVLGDRVWITGEGLRIPIRIAVHAVRRFAGGTVLDWSLTPLATAGHRNGTPLPAIDLGLTRSGEGNLNVFLIDGPHHRVYRPLTALAPDDLQHCLCAPQWIAERELTFGVTTVLQVAYPPLPADVDRVAVDITTVPLFDQVPVTPIGETPRPGSAVDLDRPAAETEPLVWTASFPYPAAPGQRLRIGIDQVSAGVAATSIQWTLESLTAGAQVNGVASVPLVADDAGSAYDYADGYASGPAITAIDRRSRPASEALSMSTRLNGLGRRECLCTDPRLWTTGLQDAGGRVSLVTDVGPLPRGTRTVDIAFPGLPVLHDVPVTAARNASEASPGSQPTEPRTWTYWVPDPVAGWSVTDWPTPLPNDRQLPGYRQTVDDLR